MPYHKKYIVLSILQICIYLGIIWFPVLNYYTQTPKTIKRLNFISVNHLSSKKHILNLLSEDPYSPNVAEETNDIDQFVDRYIPFDFNKLKKGNSSLQLRINSLSVVKGLVSIYENTNNDKYLKMAIQYFIDFVNYQSGRFIDESFLYNDHAVASRAFVVTRLWAFYRDSNFYEENIALKIWNYAGQIATRLMKESFYTYKTNHGSMQNISLMLLSSVFSRIDGSKEWGITGVRRLEEQLEYLISKEGCFLEHSFGYHKFFTKFLKSAVNIIKFTPHLSSEKIIQSYQKTLTVLQSIQRSDGSLPIMGDTSFTRSIDYDPLPSDCEMSQIQRFLESGFSIMHSSNKSCFLTIFWSNFKNHGHKKWDDGSIDVWMKDRQWWRNTGYVPYWHRFRDQSETWLGSNAPHIRTEGKPASDSVMNFLSIDSPVVQYFSFDRIINNSKKISREIICLENIIVIADHLLSSDNDFLEVFWTMDSEKEFFPLSKNSYLFKDLKTKDNLYTYFFSNGNQQIDKIYTSNTILGWVEEDSELKPATTLQARIKRKKNPSLITICVLTPDGSGKYNPPVVSMEHVGGKGDKLHLKFTMLDKIYTVKREKRKLIIEKNGYVQDYEILKLSDDYLNDIKSINDKTNSVKKKYGNRFQPLVKYRVKVSILGFSITLILVGLSFLVVRLKYQFVKVSYIAVSIGIWVALNTWIGFFYF